MLWIALYLPELPLQLALRSQPVSKSESETEPEFQQPSQQPLVVSTGPDNRPIVQAANDTAQAVGIQAGISIASARALTFKGQTLRVVARHIGHEQEAVNNLAGWAGQFTPSVSVKDAEGLLLEVASTLRLHQGLAMLLGQIRRGVKALGYRAAMGVAPTPLAAWLFAKARHQGFEIRVCQNRFELESRVANLPIGLLDWPTAVISTLTGLGIKRIADCLALPPDGFTKRFGAPQWFDLQRLLARLPDPRRYYLPPDTYQARAEFGFELNDAMTLLFPLKRLLVEMEGFLRGRGAGVLDYAITLHHAHRSQTSIRIRIAKVERQNDRLAVLAREHLINLPLSDTVTALSIQVDRLQPYQEVSESWLPDPQQQPDSWFRLLDKLTARLGADNVVQLRAVEDHRPEESWTASAANISVVTKALIKNPTKTSAKTARLSQALSTPLAPRPLFLLNTPRKLLLEQGQPRCHGAIHLISGPECIESGWWDGRPAARDYFVGRNPHGETMWLFINHHNADPGNHTNAHTSNAHADWYLHGYFA